MSYLDLAKQAQARQSAALTPHSEAADTARADELNEITKKPTSPEPVDVTAALRAAYHRWFTFMVAEADGIRRDPAEANALHQQIVKLTDDAGMLWADALFTEELRRFRWTTGRCGLCGGLGHPQEHA